MGNIYLAKRGETAIHYTIAPYNALNKERADLVLTNTEVDESLINSALQELANKRDLLKFDEYSQPLPVIVDFMTGDINGVTQIDIPDNFYLNGNNAVITQAESKQEGRNTLFMTAAIEDEEGNISRGKAHISDFRIFVADYGNHNGIYLEYGTVKNCTIESIAKYGIRVQYGSVENCSVEGATEKGIYVYNGSISDCDLGGGKDPISGYVCDIKRCNVYGDNGITILQGDITDTKVEVGTTGTAIEITGKGNVINCETLMATLGFYVAEGKVINCKSTQNTTGIKVGKGDVIGCYVAEDTETGIVIETSGNVTGCVTGEGLYTGISIAKGTVSHCTIGSGNDAAIMGTTVDVSHCNFASSCTGVIIKSGNVSYCNFTLSSAEAIFINGDDKSTVSNCNIGSCQYGAIYIKNGVVSDCTIKSCNSEGVLGENVNVDNCKFDKCETGVSITSGNITNCTFDQISTCGIKANANSYSVFSNNTFKQVKNSCVAISLVNTNNCLVTNNIFAVKDSTAQYVAMSGTNNIKKNNIEGATFVE